jgi:hypothetical protein
MVPISSATPTAASGVLFAAARRPEITLSVALLAPSAFDMAQHDPDARALVGGVRDMWDSDLPDEGWVVNFLKAVGSDPDEFPPEFLESAVPAVPTFRRARTMWNANLPLVEIAAATFPKIVVSGGHSAGFDAICDEKAQRIGASREVVSGAGHEIQFTGAPLNSLLLALWRNGAST